MTKPPTRRNPADGLGFRVAFLLAIVLLPLTVISVVKSMTVIEESRGRSEAALMGETLRAASGELRYIQETRGAAKVLSKSIWPLVSDNGACSGFLRRILELESHFSLVAFVPVSGVSTCNSAGRVFSFKDDPLYLRAAQDRGTSFAVKAVGLVSGTSVLVITHPVFDDAGSYRGFVSLSIPHSGIRAADDGGADSAPSTSAPSQPSAVLWTGERSLVYVYDHFVDPPVYQPVEVVLGDVIGDRVVVETGVWPGETIVVNGAFRIDAELQIRGGASMMQGHAPGHDEEGAP